MTRRMSTNNNCSTVHQVAVGWPALKHKRCYYVFSSAVKKPTPDSEFKNVHLCREMGYGRQWDLSLPAFGDHNFESLHLSSRYYSITIAWTVRALQVLSDSSIPAKIPMITLEDTCALLFTHSDKGKSIATSIYTGILITKDNHPWVWKGIKEQAGILIEQHASPRDKQISPFR